MLYLKTLRLQNYCGYENHTFDFTKPNGEPYPFVCFYGPNGIGKSSVLEAIAMLTANWSGRNEQHIEESLRKYVRNPDYNPAYASMEGYTYRDGYITGKTKSKLPDMLIEGTYVMDDKEYVVALAQNKYVRNDFAPVLNDPEAELSETLAHTNTGPWGQRHLQYRQRVSHFVSSDSDLSLSKFQLHYGEMEHFEKIISEIMRYPADCIVDNGVTPQEKGYCTDFCITKGDHRIHFKRMSAGEKKICKSFSEIFNLMFDLSNPEPGEPNMDSWPRIVLLDNAVMHVYYDRHVTMINCLKRIFNRQQIISTTHSGILIQRQKENKNDQNNELWIDLEIINHQNYRVEED